ncbi:MAG: NYN domain-containing protein [Planctomycetes bacterium]|nr:NYN domain-containing protein [Planctomycetota bacterium]
MDGLKRIAVFYDGSFFWKVSQCLTDTHARGSFLDIDGVHEYLRHKVAALETNNNVSMCQIVEAHFFRGRFSLKAVKALPDPAKQMETDRLQDQILMHAGVVTHYHPMNEFSTPPGEKGIDVWLALEAYDLAVHKRFDVLVLVSGDSDFVPLIRKVNGLGTRVLVLGFDIEGSKTSQKLIEEASYTVMMSEEVDSKAAKADPIVNGLFFGAST